jgi:hypothetical protein
MKRRKARANLRNKLKHSRDNYDDGRGQMYGDGQIAHGIAGNKPMRYGFTPRMKISSQRGKPIETPNRKGERELPDHNYHNPKPCGCFQRAVRSGI